MFFVKISSKYIYPNAVFALKNKTLAVRDFFSGSIKKRNNVIRFWRVPLNTTGMHDIWWFDLGKRGLLLSLYYSL
jgi:hypothetical protein